MDRFAILDHIYVKNLSDFKYKVEDLCIGDHLSIQITTSKKEKTKINYPIYMRSWKKYDIATFASRLQDVDFSAFDPMSVNDHCFELNQKIMLTLAELAPERLIHPDESTFLWSERLVNLRRKKANLIKKQRRLKTGRYTDKIKKLNKQFRSEVQSLMKKKINNIVNGNKGDPKLFWKSVNLAAGNLNGTESLPTIKYGDNTAKSPSEKASIFAKFFEKKAKETGEVNDTVYNGSNRFPVPGTNYISKEKVFKVLRELKPKTCFGYDRVPLRLLKDSAPIILDTVYNLFEKIREFKRIPDIWRISRIIPIHKNGSKEDVENYRPISNLCSIAKVYERCLLLNLYEMAENNNVDLTGKNQFGFKKNSSTISLCLQLQKRIADAIDGGKTAAAVSLDLTAAFDVINHDLLKKRLELYGIGSQLVDTIMDWLHQRYAFVECEGKSSDFFKILKGTLQGSVLGPVLFALFILPIMEIDDVDVYADDNYLLKVGKSVTEARTVIESSANKLYQWLKDSGLVVNVKKTELVFFNKKLTENQSITLGDQIITSVNTMKVLGVLFDSKLQWSHQVENAIKKAKKACCGLNRLRKFISQEKMMQMATAFAYSKLFYGAPVWLNSVLSKKLWRLLKSVSTYIIKSALGLFDWWVSYDDLHEIAGRGTPQKMSLYFTATTMYDILSTGIPNAVARDIDTKIRHLERTDRYFVANDSNTKVGLNSFSNRITYVCNVVPASYFAKTKESFKIALKKLLL